MHNEILRIKEEINRPCRMCNNTLFYICKDSRGSYRSCSKCIDITEV